MREEHNGDNFSEKMMGESCCRAVPTNLHSTADTGTADRRRGKPASPAGVAPRCQQPKQAPLVHTQLHTDPWPI